MHTHIYADTHPICNGCRQELALLLIILVAVPHHHLLEGMRGLQFALAGRISGLQDVALDAGRTRHYHARHLPPAELGLEQARVRCGCCRLYWEEISGHSGIISTRVDVAR
jgi:hypothetical protein